MTESVDVLVVGARCAGASTAMLLARAGLSVLVVDRSAEGSDTLSTHAFMRPGVLALSRWGVLDAVRAAGTPRVSRVVYHYGDDEVPIDVAPLGDVDGLYAPRRTVLDPILVDAARAAGADVRHGVSFRDVVRDPSGRVTGAVLRDADGEREVSCRWLVGADGAGSRVAQAVHAPVLHRASGSTAMLYAFVGGLDQSSFVNWFRPGATAGLIPTNDGLANVWAGLPFGLVDGSARRDLPGLFARTLLAAAPELADAVLDGRDVDGLRLFAGRLGEMRRAHGPGWALVGDAASAEDPIGAHGMTKALIGAELLARTLTSAASGADETDVLSAYDTQRSLLERRMLGPLEEMVALGDPEHLKSVHLRANRAHKAEWTLLDGLAELRSPEPAADDRAYSASSWSDLAPAI